MLIYFLFAKEIKKKKTKKKEEDETNNFQESRCHKIACLRKRYFALFLSFSFSFAHQFKIYEVLSESTRLNTRAARQMVHSLKSNYSGEFEKLNSTFPIRLLLFANFSLAALIKSLITRYEISPLLFISAETHTHTHALLLLSYYYLP